MLKKTDDAITFTELRAENFKRLSAVRIRPDGAVVQITGRNDQGKSSVLDAFAAAVGGKAFCPKVPIKKGQEEAEIFVDLGSLRITRRWWFKKTDGDLTGDLVVEYADGTKPKNPQATLDELRGSDIAADPLEFMRLSPKEKFDQLRQLVPGVDFDKLAKDRKELFEERTQAGRMRDRAKAAADAITVPAGTPLKLVEVSELVQAMADASDANTAIARDRDRRARFVESVEAKRNQADALYVQAKALEKAANDLEADVAKLDPLPEPVSTTEIQMAFDGAELTNASVRLLQQQDQHREEFKAQDKAYDDLTARITILDDSVAKAIAKAKLPVSNMGFGENELLMNGVPFEEASKANQIRACTAIAMALKPKLKVILIRDGSLLDDDSMAELGKMVEENGFVVLLERVAQGGKRIGVVIEDGEVT